MSIEYVWSVGAQSIFIVLSHSPSPTWVLSSPYKGIMAYNLGVWIEFSSESEKKKDKAEIKYHLASTTLHSTQFIIYMHVCVHICLHICNRKQNNNRRLLLIVLLRCKRLN